MRVSPVLAVLAGLLVGSSHGDPARATEKGSGWGDTAAAITEAYSDELASRGKYLEFARKADREGFPNISYLFSALSASEEVHARNYGKLLAELGIPVPPHPVWRGNVASTRENLDTACEVEIEEIDTKYPGMLERLRAEHHADAIRYVRFAWESEKQHRDLLATIRSGTGMFFGRLVRKIEGSPVIFSVCRECGSTVKKVPDGRCPICGGDPSRYERVDRIR